MKSITLKPHEAQILEKSGEVLVVRVIPELDNIGNNGYGIRRIDGKNYEYFIGEGSWKILPYPFKVGEEVEATYVIDRGYDELTWWFPITPTSIEVKEIDGNYYWSVNFRKV